MRSRKTERESEKNVRIREIRIILAALAVALILNGCALELIGVTSEKTGLYISQDEKGRPIVVNSAGERQQDYLVDKGGNIATWDNRTITVLARYTNFYIAPESVLIRSLQETAMQEAPVMENRVGEDIPPVMETPVPEVPAVQQVTQAEETPAIQNRSNVPVQTVPYQTVEYRPIIPVSTTEPVIKTVPVMPVPQRKEEINPERNILPSPVPKAHEESAEISEHDHIWEEIARQEPSCTEAGTTVMNCRICGEARTETLNAEHVFNSSGVCLRCGMTDENKYRTFGRNLAQSEAGEYEKMTQIVDFVLINAAGNSCTGYSSKCMEAAEAAGIQCTARTVWDILCPVTGCEHTPDSFDNSGYCRCGLGNNHTWVRFTLSDGFYEYDLQGAGRESPGRNTQIHG